MMWVVFCLNSIPTTLVMFNLGCTWKNWKGHQSGDKTEEGETLDKNDCWCGWWMGQQQPVRAGGADLTRVRPTPHQHTAHHQHQHTAHHQSTYFDPANTKVWPLPSTTNQPSKILIWASLLSMMWNGQSLHWDTMTHLKNCWMHCHRHHDHDNDDDHHDKMAMMANWLEPAGRWGDSLLISRRATMPHYTRGKQRYCHHHHHPHCHHHAHQNMIRRWIATQFVKDDPQNMCAAFTVLASSNKQVVRYNAAGINSLELDSVRVIVWTHLRSNRQ